MQQNYTGKSLISFMAHPDDETFGMGGTLALYAKLGVKVHLVTGTRGEAGEVDPRHMQGYASIADLRSHELDCAARLLNLASVTYLDYCDSGMAGSEHNNNPACLFQAPLEKVTADITHLIRLHQPDLVLTFDPIGGYRHPDHIVIHNATVAAFRLCADPAFDDPLGLPPFQPERLYFHVIPRDFLRLSIKVLQWFGKDPSRFGKNGDIDLASIAEVEYPIHARINYRKVQSLRYEASACHASQGGGKMGGGIFGPLTRLFSKPVDSFMQAWPEPADGRVSTDLFVGLD